MRRILFIVALLTIPSLAHAQGALLPFTEGQFVDALGIPIASGFVCTTISGTTTNLATYPTRADANAGTNANTNPVLLDSAGRANIFIGTGTYRIALFNPVGVGSGTCNGTTTGSAIKTVDGVAGFGSLLASNNTWSGTNTFTGAVTITALNNVRDCNSAVGINAGLKLAACMTALGSSGGIANAQGIRGAQTIAVNPFTGITAPILLLLGPAAYTTSVNLDIPSNVHIVGMGDSSQILVATGGGNYSSSDIIILSTTNASNVAIENIRVTGAGKAYPGSDLTGGTAIAAVGSSNIRIEGVHVENALIGVDLRGTSQSSVHGSYFSGKMVQDGVRIFCPNGGNASFNTVEGNRFDNTGSATTGSAMRAGGDAATCANHNTFVGNTVKGVAVEAVMLEYASQIVVSGNSISGTGYGVVVASGTGATIVGNTMKDIMSGGVVLVPSATGEFSDYATVSGNTLNNVAIAAATDSMVVNIHGGVGGVSAKGNRFANNIIIGGTRRCIYNAGSFTAMVGNTCIGQGEIGILNDGSVNDAIIADNTIIDPTGDAISTGSSQRLFISGNKCRLTTGAMGTYCINTSATNSYFGPNEASGFSPTPPFAGLTGSGDTLFGSPGINMTGNIVTSGNIQGASGTLTGLTVAGGTNGIVLGSPTGSDKGSGSINIASGVYLNGTAGETATLNFRAAGGMVDCTVTVRYGSILSSTCN